MSLNLSVGVTLSLQAKSHRGTTLSMEIDGQQELSASPVPFGNEAYNDEQPSYIPPQLVNCCSNTSEIMYHCYLIEMKQKFSYDIPVNDVVLLTRSELGSDIGSLQLELFVEGGCLSVNFRHVGGVYLTAEQVLLSRRYQVTLFRVLLDHNLNKLTEALDKLCLGDNLEIDYLMLPAAGIDQRHSIIDWVSVNICVDHINHTLLEDHARNVWTINGWICTCKLLNSLVYTPHNGHVYCITGTLELNGNSLLNLRGGEVITYKKYYEQLGIQLSFEQEPLFKARHIFKVHNYLQGCSRKQRKKESRNTYVELPPELCTIIMSPISISTVYTFSFVPSIMHRLESLLVAYNLKRMHLESDYCTQNDIPTFKILEAITTKKCQENFHLESLETLGDSFLKYAASQQLFKTYHNDNEGLLSLKREQIISNANLCSIGCGRKIPGFIRNESFDLKRWIIPGERSGSNSLNEELLSEKLKIYVLGRRKLEHKTVADVVEALIGAFLSTGGEKSALLFLSWIGIKVDFEFIPHERHLNLHPEELVNVGYLESLLNYKFRDTSLLVEALTHGSYTLPDIPRCYQRLEFLGDAVLDYLITLHLYKTYPRMSPGLLTDMRAASVNNDCYARSSIKAELHKHILHSSQGLGKHIIETVNSFEKLSSESTFGWESETSFSKVLGDIVESLAGAILLDSGYNKDMVFQSIRPLLEPLVTTETVMLHPVRELTELCQKEHYTMREPIRSHSNGVCSVTIEVEADGFIYKHTSTSSDKKIAKKLACREVLKSLKERISTK